MTNVPTKPASGMRDFLADDIQKRRRVMDVVTDVYESFGFEPLQTPSLERLSTLLGKYGEEGEKLIFRIMKRGQKLERALDDDETSIADLGLRYDLTVPLARVVAEHRNEIPSIYKRYQIAPVWRADRPQKGRYREFYQCDVDIVGTESMMAEAEVAEASARILRQLGFENFRIHINHKKLLQAALEYAEVSDKLREGALVAIDKQDKIGLNGVKEELVERGASDTAVDKLMGLLEIGHERPREPGEFQNEPVISGIRDKLVEYEGVEDSLGELTNLFEFISESEAAKHLYLDPSLARGLSYYTGPLFEIRSDDFSGSLGAGGRYDDLIGMFAGKEYPACGFSLGIERILVLMEENDMFGQSSAPADVLVTRWNDELTPMSLRLVRDLRDSGLSVDFYPESDGLGSQFGYADNRNIPFVAIIAPDEANEGTVSIKNMESGDQETISTDEAAGWLNERLG